MFLPTELPPQSTLNSHTLKKKLFLDWKMKNCKLFLDLQRYSFGSHRITEWLGLEGTSKIIYPQLSIILESTLAFQKSFWAITVLLALVFHPLFPQGSFVLMVSGLHLPLSTKKTVPVHWLYLTQCKMLISDRFTLGFYCSLPSLVFSQSSSVGNR